MEAKRSGTGNSRFPWFLGCENEDARGRECVSEAAGLAVPGVYVLLLSRCHGMCSNNSGAKRRRSRNKKTALNGPHQGVIALVHQSNSSSIVFDSRRTRVGPVSMGIKQNPLQEPGFIVLGCIFVRVCNAFFFNILFLPVSECVPLKHTRSPLLKTYLGNTHQPMCQDLFAVQNTCLRLFFPLPLTLGTFQLAAGAD